MHFSLAVLSKSSEDVSRLMAPYQNGGLGDCENEYLSFIDQTEKIKKIYEDEYADEFDSFVEYADHYKYTKSKNDDGRYGFYGNPNGKYDHYTIGGGWKGMLIVENDCTDYIIGKTTRDSYYFDDEGDYKRVDSAKIKDIKFDTMYDVEIDRRKEVWEEYQHMLKIGDDTFIIEALNNINEDMQLEEYLDRLEMFSTYAVITEDGRWLDEHSNNKEEIDKLFEDMTTGTDYDDLYITIIDYHI